MPCKVQGDYDNDSISILRTQIGRITDLQNRVSKLEGIVEEQEKRIAELEKLLNYHLKIETE